MTETIPNHYPEQAEAPLTPEQVQDAKNVETLGQSEMGATLIEAYSVAKLICPRLTEMSIVPITDPTTKSLGYAVPGWREGNESGKHEVHIRLSDLDSTLSRYQDAPKLYPDSMAIAAERMGVDFNDLTPQFLYVTSVLHEMGHVNDFFNHEGKEAEFDRRERVESIATPLGRISLTELLDTGSDLNKTVRDTWPDISSRHGVETIEDLAGVQGRAIRNMTSERDADNFAAIVMATKPELRDALLAP